MGTVHAFAAGEGTVLEGTDRAEEGTVQAFAAGEGTVPEGTVQAFAAGEDIVPGDTDWAEEGITACRAVPSEEDIDRAVPWVAEGFVQD